MTSGNGQASRQANPRTMRLPGSVAEIEGSPPGPDVGAFFDLDGTLVAGFTGVIMTQDRLRRRQMSVGEFIGMVQAGLNHQLGRSEFEDLIGKGARMMRGSSLDDIDELAERLFVQKIVGRIYPEMRELVRAHMARGHTVVLSSSALTVQVEPVARFLGIQNVLSNKFETDDDGLLTGEVLTPIIWGPGKARAVQAFAAKNGVDLSKSYFYADGDEDVALMYLVGNPRPTNPAGKLAAVAAKRGWPVLKFTSRSGSSPVSQLRTAAGVASMMPIAAGAIGLGLLTRNKRTGVNFFTSAFGRTLLTATGINLNVLGKENLTAQRPAVFIFNHRNQADPMIAGRLVETNFTSVGKKELEKDPIVGTIGKVMDAAFIDRDDPKKAVEGLKKVEELARKGLSILIAPEGTRLDTTEVGPFKKGPFRIAMSAGIPIVPIVIRNAEVVAARDSSTFNPGTVDVVVYPPIPIDDWTHENLVDRIAEVRQLYLDTLKDWPHDELPKPDLYKRTKAPAKKADGQEGDGQEGDGQEGDGQEDGRQGSDEKGWRERPPVKVPADHFAPFTTTDDALVLASVSSPAEQELLNDWLERQRRDHPDSKVEVLRLPADDPPPAVLAQLVSELEADEDRSVVPVRVFWVPGGLPTRSKVVSFLSGRDTYRPPEILQRRILRKDPSRARVVAGEPAKVSELRQQWADTTVAENSREFARFVIRRAILAIERVELRLLGPEYKSPRLIKPELLASARFREGLERIPGATMETAGEMLDELSTGWSRFSVDLIPSLGRAIFSRGFDPNIDYDRGEVESMRRHLENHPAVLLFSHRSYLDGVIVPVAMQENRLPPVHTFAGINLSFGFMGPLMRHSGVIFIRRKLDDPLYKYVLRQFVGYIVEKRFNLSWSIEGTRSRTGKMLPPKLGLLAYVADAYLDGRSDDILLQPVSISFDQLHETAEYAAYARGGEKTPEGLSWMYNFIKAQGERNYGKIYVRFPEAVSMREYLGEPHGPMATDDAAKRLALQKMAFEVAWRILRVTPVNASALVSALLLTTRGVALTLDQLHHTLQDSLDYLERKQTPMTNSALRLRTAEGVRAALDALSNGHPVTCVDGGREPVWRIAPEDEHEAAFYRNTLIDAFLETSIVELALAYAARAEGDRLEAFWSQAMRLRDLLKFDFYFADSAAFRHHVAEEMSWYEDWESHVSRGEIDQLLRAKRPLVASAMLRSFFEAYEIVADVLRDAPAEIAEKDLTKRALGVGRQYVAQSRVRSNEAVSALLFATARQVAADQHLLESAADLDERRITFRDELRAILRDMDKVEQISREQFYAREIDRRSLRSEPA